MDDKNHFFVDTIDMERKELQICIYSSEHELIRVIETGFLFEETEDNYYSKRNEMIGLYSDGNLLYIYYTGNRYIKENITYVHVYDLETGERINGIELKGISNWGIFVFVYDWSSYHEPLWDDGDVIYQIRLLVNGDRILLDGYYRVNGGESVSTHDIEIFNMQGELVYIGYTSGYNQGKTIYPVAFDDDGEIVKGIHREADLEKAVNKIGFSFKEGRTIVHRCFMTSDMLIEKDRLWLSKYIFRIGSDSYRLMNYEPAIFGFKKQDGDWKFTEFINFLNFPELRYNIFIDRILRAEGDKLWLWVRVGHNLTESYEKRYFDREIWVIEESDN